MQANLTLEAEDFKALRNEDYTGVTMSVAEARDLIDQLDDDSLVYALDNAQGEVFSRAKKVTYVIIKIED